MKCSCHTEYTRHNSTDTIIMLRQLITVYMRDKFHESKFLTLHGCQVFILVNDSIQIKISQKLKFMFLENLYVYSNLPSAKMMTEFNRITHSTCS